jgi:hypothetical protein
MRGCCLNCLTITTNCLTSLISRFGQLIPVNCRRLTSRYVFGPNILAYTLIHQGLIRAATKKIIL